MGRSLLTLPCPAELVLLAQARGGGAEGAVTCALVLRLDTSGLGCSNRGGGKRPPALLPASPASSLTRTVMFAFAGDQRPAQPLTHQGLLRLPLRDNAFRSLVGGRGRGLRSCEKRP